MKENATMRKPWQMRLTIMIAAGVLLASMGGNVQAQGNGPSPAGLGVPLVLSFSAGTINIQNAPTTSGNSKTYTVTKRPPVWADVIRDCQNSVTFALDSKAKLVYDPNIPGVIVVDGVKTSSVISEVTVTLDPEGTGGVWAGSVAPGAIKLTGSYQIRIDLNLDSGSQMTAYGLATETMSVSIKKGIETDVDSINATLVADGIHTGDAPGVVYGIKFTASGKQTISGK